MVVVPSSKMSREQMRRRTRDHLHTDSEGLGNDPWQSALIDRELNASQRWVMLQVMMQYNEEFSKATQFNLNGIDFGFDVPDDFIRERELARLTDGSVGEAGFQKVIIVRVRDLDRYRPIGPHYINEPTYEVWYQRGRQFRAMRSTPPSGTYRLVYDAFVPDLQADVQVSDLPIEYHELNTLHTAWKLASRAGEGKLAAQIKMDEQDELAMLREMKYRSMTVEDRVSDVEGWNSW